MNQTINLLFNDDQFIQYRNNLLYLSTRPLRRYKKRQINNQSNNKQKGELTFKETKMEENQCIHNNDIHLQKERKMKEAGWKYSNDNYLDKRDLTNIIKDWMMKQTENVIKSFVLSHTVTSSICRLVAVVDCTIIDVLIIIFQCYSLFWYIIATNSIYLMCSLIDSHSWNDLIRRCTRLVLMFAAMRPREAWVMLIISFDYLFKLLPLWFNYLSKIIDIIIDCYGWLNQSFNAVNYSINIVPVILNIIIIFIPFMVYDLIIIGYKPFRICTKEKIFSVLLLDSGPWCIRIWFTNDFLCKLLLHVLNCCICLRALFNNNENISFFGNVGDIGYTIIIMVIIKYSWNYLIQFKTIKIMFVILLITFNRWSIFWLLIDTFIVLMNDFILLINTFIAFMNIFLALINMLLNNYYGELIIWLLNKYIDKIICFMFFISHHKGRMVLLFPWYRVIMIVVELSELMTFYRISPIIRYVIILFEGDTISFRKWYKLPYNVYIYYFIQWICGIKTWDEIMDNLWNCSRHNYVMSFTMANDSAFRSFKECRISKLFEMEKLRKEDTYNKTIEKPATIILNDNNRIINEICHRTCVNISHAINGVTSKTPTPAVNSLLLCSTVSDAPNNKNEQKKQRHSMLQNKTCNNSATDQLVTFIVKGGSVVIKIAASIIKKWGGLSDFDANIIFNQSPTKEMVDIFIKQLKQCCSTLFEIMPEELMIPINGEIVKLQTPLKHIIKQVQQLWYTPPQPIYDETHLKWKVIKGLTLCNASKIIILMNMYYKRSKTITKTHEGAAIINYNTKNVLNVYSYNWLSTPIDTFNRCNWMNYPFYNLFHLFRIKLIYVAENGDRVYPEVLDLSLPQWFSGKYVGRKTFQNNMENGYYVEFDGVMYNSLSKTAADCAAFLKKECHFTPERQEKSIKRILICKEINNEEAMRLINDSTVIMTIENRHQVLN